MEISIIIPLYNVEKYIKRCLRSVVEQTFTDYEIILVDDCSQDNSLKMAEQFLTENNITFQARTHTKNKKQGAARNSGLEVAKGKYIFFIDADDELAGTDTLQVLYAEMVRDNYDFVTAKAQHIVGGYEMVTAKTNTSITVLDDVSILKAFSNDEIAPVVWNKLVRRSFLLENGIQFIEHTLFEDIPYCFILCCEAKKVALIDQITYRYYFADNAGATTASLDDEKVQNAITMLEALLGYVDKNNIVKLVGVYLIYQIVCRNISYVLGHHSLITDKEKWIKYYAMFQGVYNQSFLFTYRRRLSLPADFAYYLTLRPYVSKRSNIVNSLYNKLLSAIRVYNMSGAVALMHKILQKKYRKS